MIPGISSICIPRSLFRNTDSGAQRSILTSSLGEVDAVKFENHCVWPSCGINWFHHENGNIEAGKELWSKLEREGVLPVGFLLAFFHCQIKTQSNWWKGNSEMGASEHSISFLLFKSLLLIYDILNLMFYSFWTCACLALRFTGCNARTVTEIPEENMVIVDALIMDSWNCIEKKKKVNIYKIKSEQQI